MMKVLFNVIFLIQIVFIDAYSSNFLGPAHVTLKRMERCADDGEGVKLEFEMKKINRTHQGIDVSIETIYDFGSDVQLNVTVSKWGDGGWKPHVFDLFEEHACEFFLKYGKDKFTDILEMQGRPKTCPVEKGAFSVTNYIYDGNVPVPVMYGDFKSEMMLYYKMELKLCIILYINTKPKQKM